MPQSFSFTTIYKGRASVLVNDVMICTAYTPPNPPGGLIRKRFMAIWDTGATHTVITKKVVEDCQLKSSGMANVSHAGGDDEAKTYYVNVLLRNNVEVYNVKVTEGKIKGPANVLVGMNIISKGDFAVTCKDGNTLFSYRYPSMEKIDFVKHPKRTDALKAPPKISRNSPCPCGSGKKYKNCCLNKDQGYTKK